MNLLTLRAQARTKSGINSSDYSDATLDIQLNEAYYTLARLLSLLGENYFEEQNVLFNLGQNSALYSLPTDFMAMRQVRIAYTAPTGPAGYRVAVPYDITDVGDIAIDEENIPPSNPIYDITGNYFRLKPTPTAAITNGGKLAYIAMPSALVNTGDTPLIPIAYHDLMSEYGAMQMTYKYEKWRKFQASQQIWQAKIAELTQTLADRDDNKPLRFKAPQEQAMIPNRNRRELPYPPY